MKKIALFLFIVACGVIVFVLIPKHETKTIEEQTKEVEENKEEEEEVKYVDNNPIKLGLYKNYKNGSNRVLVNEYEEVWTYHKDISSFEVYYTQEEKISGGKQISVFDNYKNNYENIDDYRIGYILNFSINDEEVTKTILSPIDAEEYNNYLEVYLYDDYHRNGEWYSHTTEEEYNKDTLLTSIKLTAGKQINELNSDIKLSAFSYIKDDLDKDGNYLGNSIWTITIKKK